MTARNPEFKKFLDGLCTHRADTICALANDAAERGEPQARANLYKPRTPRYTFFLICYLERREELKLETQAADVIEKAKSGGGVA